MTKNKKIISALLALILALGLVFWSQGFVLARDGDLELNTDAIYDDGHDKQERQKDYEVPDLFLQDKKSEEIKTQKSDAKTVKKAEKSVFLHNSRQNTKAKDEKTVEKYLFTKKFTGAKTVGIEKKNKTWWDLHQSIVVYIIVGIGVVGLGIILGLRFPDLFSRLKERRMKNGKQ